MSKLCRYGLTGTFAVLLMGLGACKKWLPEDLDYLSPKATYSQKSFTPTLGRTTVFSGIYNTDNSTTPLTFKIMNVRNMITGQPSTDLNKVIPVWVWKQGYTGDEKSVAEINAKRIQENHPLWEIREHSGDFILWAGADSSMVAQVPNGGYLFDVVASNSGGSNTYKDLTLLPYRELPYSPSADIDPLTGAPAIRYTSDSSSYARVYNHPGMVNIMGDSTELPMKSDSVRVLFHKTGNGSSLTFKFMDKDSLPINPALFNATGPLDSLIHGFSPKLTSEYIRFDVAYPIPLIKYPTRWTVGDGSQAKVRFAYDRKVFGGSIARATLDFYFAIYQKGDWEIIFYFYSDTPRFRNE
ncbi:DUF5007 domain-containing protein [Chitinophaga arvensicola]|uniref:DUF5007 domain-containing protein n=1 Tax=Chitinophaga arvensicola TaxID=29529 RepID=A0A1I0S9X8_9BACT|nr:DUF5007 domain-containing protein [Chitinophaga arvensicola]SEW52987.1 protein of unknown function [Chitinophaga arvensicola]